MCPESHFCQPGGGLLAKGSLALQVTLSLQRSPVLPPLCPLTFYSHDGKCWMCWINAGSRLQSSSIKSDKMKTRGFWGLICPQDVWSALGRANNGRGIVRSPCARLWRLLSFLRFHFRLVYNKRQDGVSWAGGMLPGLYCSVTTAQSRPLNTWSTMEICIENKKSGFLSILQRA